MSFEEDGVLIAFRVCELRLRLGALRGDCLGGSAGRMF